MINKLIRFTNVGCEMELLVLHLFIDLSTAAPQANCEFSCACTNELSMQMWLSEATIMWFMGGDRIAF